MRKKAGWICLCVALGFSLRFTGQVRSLANSAGSPRNIARVKTGIFEYRDSDHGRQVGRGRITIQRLADSGNLSFITKADFAEGFSGFHSQRWEAVTSPEFRPLFAKLAFLRDEEVVPVFELRYESGKATGFVVSHKGSTQDMKQTVDAPVPEGIIDQRIDWAAILASDLESGERIEFNVFDPVTGVSRVAAEVGPTEVLRVPSGTFSAFRVDYQMEKPSRIEHYRLFVTKKLPHVMLREDFPNGVVSELMRAVVNK
jgi:hypothetical protein